MIPETLLFFFRVLKIRGFVLIFFMKIIDELNIMVASGNFRIFLDIWINTILKSSAGGTEKILGTAQARRKHGGSSFGRKF